MGFLREMRFVGMVVREMVGEEKMWDDEGLRSLAESGRAKRVKGCGVEEVNRVKEEEGKRGNKVVEGD